MKYFILLIDFLHKSKIVEGFLGKTKTSRAAYIDTAEQRRRAATTKLPTRLTYAGSLILFSIFNLTATGAIPASNEADEDFRYTYTYGKGCHQVYDPYETLNRKIFAFNSVLDYLLLRPVTIGYKNLTNAYTKARVSSFIDNISTPVTIVNYGLQGNYAQTMKSVWRFLINTTFGIGGLFDVASKMGLTVAPQSFGSTLANYGVGPGPYLVLPFLGGTNARDVTDSVFTNTYFNPIMHMVHRDFRVTVFGAQTIDTRLALLPFTDYVAQNSTDPYIAIKSATHQNRESVLFYPKQFVCPK
ncbi:VacJ family lipoprotein [Candidatus Tisiphia endosymbiont of Beris chalybata]|uniref:MlaA family lipoprotein n=1 Tax=Candidatus Tisiphia endosymbiont of Beris chalybata TaxID=3066262 RepID=UPI003977A806